MRPPAYFEKVRQRAAARWDQLEADRELAGPWHQLFRQVQSPRHVLSELLQNADDAGAKRAAVQFENGVFTFDHDGSDFTEDQFASLCRFGFSNKRSLHTIGFRGIGFKSTFSLGDTVEVLSPTLAVSFNQRRFTEPCWIGGAQGTATTTVRVKVADENRGNQLRGSLAEWAESPSSLLFFKNLKELTIDGITVRKRVTKYGPVANSAFLSLIGEESERLFLVQSAPEALPEDAAEEVRAERGVTDVEDLHLPPCEIEIVLGLKAPQRLYVVLPTGVEIPVPFSINAPFIQDPARMKIKDPSTSPTNRWLLERAGRLLGETLVGWLANKDLDLAERARAYDLLPTETEFDNSLGGQCAEIIFEVFDETVNDERIALTTQGSVAHAGETLAVPPSLHSVWDPAPLREIFGDEESRFVLAREVAPDAVEAIANRDWIAYLDAEDIISRLGQSSDVPRPRGWENLQVLWEFVSVYRHWEYYTDELRGLQLVPTQGDKLLHPASDTIRLSSKRDQLKDNDWEFLLTHTQSVAPDWITWVSKLPTDSEKSARNRTGTAGRLLQRLGLHEPTPVDRVVAQAFRRLVEPGETEIADCVRMAQIMASLSATIPKGFQYVTRDRHLREADHGIIWEETGVIEELVPDDWAEEHFLHETYAGDFVSCTREQWRTWAQSSASGLHVSIPIAGFGERPWHRKSVEQLAVERGGHKPTSYPYRRDSFLMKDFDFPKDLRKFWTESKMPPEHWGSVFCSVLRAPTETWNEKLVALIFHEGTQYSQRLDCGPLRARWVQRFRSMPCLPDTCGKLHVPADLLLRTPDTEPLMGIEQFVHADFDLPANRPLLRALGVRDNPADPDKILDRLRGLARGPDPSRIITEIARLYEALDRVVARLDPARLGGITEILTREDLLLSDSDEWLSAGEISIYGDPETAAPGIHPSVQRLGMWLRLNISEHPAIERTIEWLQSVESGQKLEVGEFKRIRQVLQREPSRIWHTCGHWVSLAGTWEPVDALRFRLSMQELTKWTDLSPAIKKTTADLRMLPEGAIRTEIFHELRNLSDAVEFRVTRCEGARSQEIPEWLVELATGLCRVKLPSDDDTLLVWELADRIRASRWHRFRQLEVTPYVDGDPAGEGSSPNAFWSEEEIYLADLPIARIHKDLCEELGRPFGVQAIQAAFAACVDRDEDFVRDYVETNFTLDPEVEVREVRSGDFSKAKKPEPAANGLEDYPDDPEIEEPEEHTYEEILPSGNAPTEPEATGDEEPGASQPSPSSPTDPKMIERYAEKYHYHLNGGAAFVHHDGRQLRKDDAPFHWVEVAANGDLIRRLWLVEQRLSTGIEVSHELWQTIKRNPDTCAVVLLDDESGITRLTGRQINQKKEVGQVSVFPSKYRVVQNQ